MEGQIGCDHPHACLLEQASLTQCQSTGPPRGPGPARHRQWTGWTREAPSDGTLPPATKLTAAGRTQPAIVERQLDFDSPNWTFSSEMEAAPLTFRLLCADALCGKRRRQCGRGSRRATHRQGALSRNASQPRSAAGLRSLSTMQLRGEF